MGNPRADSLGLPTAADWVAHLVGTTAVWTDVPLVAQSAVRLVARSVVRSAHQWAVWKAATMADRSGCHLAVQRAGTSGALMAAWSGGQSADLRVACWAWRSVVQLDSTWAEMLGQLTADRSVAQKAAVSAVCSVEHWAAMTAGPLDIQTVVWLVAH